MTTPAPLPVVRCAVRDMNGRQCRSNASLEEGVHEDPSHNYEDRRWFWVPVCGRHVCHKTSTRPRFESARKRAEARKEKP